MTFSACAFSCLSSGCLGAVRGAVRMTRKAAVTVDRTSLSPTALTAITVAAAPSLVHPPRGKGRQP